MKSRLTTVLLVLGLVVFGAGGAWAASSHLGLAKGHHGKKHAKHHGKKHHGRSGGSVTQPNTQGSDNNGENASQNQYGTRPGKGCGDRNHVHTGPPGNPSNTACPPQSQHSGSSGPSTSKAHSHHARHHSRNHGRGKKKGHGKHPHS